MSQNNNLGFSIERVFDAPLALVWKAHTEAEHLARWWGPRGWKTTVVSLDLRPGGMFHYAIEAPSGPMWGKFVYREVVPQERLVYVISFADAQGNTVRAPFDPNWPLENIATVTFREEGGKTHLLIEGAPLNATDAELESFQAGRGGMVAGTNATYDQLAEYLAHAE